MAFQEAVKATLTKIGLTDFDVLVTSREEQLESLDEFLSMAKGSSVKDSCEELLSAWATHRPAKTAQPQGPVKQKDVIAELKSEMQAMQVAPQEQKKLTKEEKEEKKKKDLLLQRFGYDVAEVDMNGDILLPVESKADSSSGLVANTNAAAISEAERQKREKSKSDHEKKVARDKEMQAKQAADREKAKKRTQKQERRGRGY